MDETEFKDKCNFSPGSGKIEHQKSCRVNDETCVQVIYFLKKMAVYQE